MKPLTQIIDSSPSSSSLKTASSRKNPHLMDHTRPQSSVPVRSLALIARWKLGSPSAKKALED